VSDVQEDGSAVEEHGENVSAHVQDGTVAVKESLIQHVPSKNAACYLLKKPLDLVLTAEIKVVDKSRVLLDAAKGALSVAQGVVNAAKRSLDLAIGFLEGVKKAYHTGVNAMSALANFALTKIINIREMYFKAGLSVANGGVFHCRIRGVLMGKSVNLNLSFDTHNTLSIARALAEQAFSGISKFIG